MFNKDNVTPLFENLISNPIEQLTKVCKFIGVGFSPDMLNYPSHSTYDAPNSAAIQQWKKSSLHGTLR